VVEYHLADLPVLAALLEGTLDDLPPQFGKTVLITKQVGASQQERPVRHLVRLSVPGRTQLLQREDGGVQRLATGPPIELRWERARVQDCRVRHFIWPGVLVPRLVQLVHLAQQTQRALGLGFVLALGDGVDYLQWIERES
jgi:hypothetical protein